MPDCFFCQRQKEKDFIVENETFFAIYDNFPVSKGHSLIIPKRHIESFFDLQEKELKDCYTLISKVREIIESKLHPLGFNIGINEGRAAGRTIDHLHIHFIPRYQGDVENPTGGVRNVIPDKGDYTSKLKK